MVEMGAVEIAFLILHTVPEIFMKHWEHRSQHCGTRRIENKDTNA